MINEPKHLVIGMGEIGKPIYNILFQYYDVNKYDKSDGVKNPYFVSKFDVMHICFGHRENEVDDFKKWVDDYRQEFLKEGGITVIHSTVAIGICNSLGAIHSPVIGQHPFMEEYIRRLPKIFAGERAFEAAEYFRRVGLKVLVYDDAEESEAAKLFLTESYRINIEFCQRVKKFCDSKGLSFHNVYTLPAMIYNEGYKHLGHEEYLRPILTPNPNPIGGHCVVPNSKLIKLSE